MNYYLALFLIIGTVSFSKSNDASVVRRTAEIEVRQLVEPILVKYCNDQCKVLSVEAQVDLSVPDGLTPGFEETQTSNIELSPSLVKIKLLTDEMLGTNTKSKIIDLLQQHVDGLPYPVSFDIKSSRFPQPATSARKVAELRERVSRQIQDTLQGLIDKVCPVQCVLGELNVQVEAVNPEETQYAQNSEVLQDGDVAIRISSLNSTLLLDQSLAPNERTNIVEMAKIKLAYLKNANIKAEVKQFPKGLGPDGNTNWLVGGNGRSNNSRSNSNDTSNSRTTASTNESTTNDTSTTNENNSNVTNESKSNVESNTKNTSNEINARQERYEKFEKIERVENGDAVQAEIKTLKQAGLIFACVSIALLLMIAVAGFRKPGSTPVSKIFSKMSSDPASETAPSTYAAKSGGKDSFGPNEGERAAILGRRYEISRMENELTNLFSEQPKVAKTVFSRILAEDGVEVTAQYMEIFGDSVVIDLLRDPSIQTDVQDLVDFYARNPQTIADDEKLELLRTLYNKAIASKLIVLGNRSSGLFDFLSEMDSPQILEMVRNESLTVKAIILTQCDAQKRQGVYGNFDEETRSRLLTELSRIDHLPKNYIYNVAQALKRKRNENPKLNTESLPGSDVLIGLLERASLDTQRTVIRNLDVNSPDSARIVRSKLVSINTLRYLKDSQLLDLVLSIKHDELLTFLKSGDEQIKQTIYSKSPKDLVAELEEELSIIEPATRDALQTVERKVVNRIKIMSTEGSIQLNEVNERMFSEQAQRTPSPLNGVQTSEITMANATGRAA